MKKIAYRLSQILIYLKYILVLIIAYPFGGKKDIWLIAERGDEARDNAYAFYKYMKANHKEVKVAYVISKDSKDIDKINKEDIIYYQSFKHIWYFIVAKYLISTHIMGMSPQMNLFSRLDKSNLVWVKGKRIFLQHGIILNKLPEAFVKNLKVDIFCTTTNREYEFLKDEIGINKDILRLTGLARYDYLDTSIVKEELLFMPTWRSNLFYTSSEDFKLSNYYKKCQDLLTNPNIISFLEESGLKLIFYPHHETQRFIDTFYSSSKNVIIASDKEYYLPSLIHESKVLITDYSSVHFDFAMTKKPIIYYQFDKEDFFKNHYQSGYFNYNIDGFGDVCETADEVSRSLIKLATNDYKISADSELKINNFFKYFDSNNSERIYNEIKKESDVDEK